MFTWDKLLESVPSYGIALAVLYMLWQVLSRFLSVFGHLEDAFKAQVEVIRDFVTAQNAAMREVSECITELRRDLITYLEHQRKQDEAVVLIADALTRLRQLSEAPSPSSRRSPDDLLEAAVGKKQ